MKKDKIIKIDVCDYCEKEIKLAFATETDYTFHKKCVDEILRLYMRNKRG